VTPVEDKDKFHSQDRSPDDPGPASGPWHLQSALPWVPWTMTDVAWATVVFGTILGSFLISVLVIRTIQARFAPAGSPYLNGVLLLILESGLIIPVWLFTVRRYPVRWSALGFRPFKWTTGCGLIIALLLISMVVNAAWAILLAAYDLQVQPDIRLAFGRGSGGVIIALLAAGIVAPLVEETFFRGFLFPALLQRYRLWAAVVLDSLIFAFVHFTPTAVAPLFVLGAMLCVLYRFTGSLWPSIIMHAVMNTLAVLATYAIDFGLVPTTTT
jgi:membrane protease YdiL (CAAX protease family)